jgi:hypothetical protein
VKAYGGVDIQVHIFLTSALALGEWPALAPGKEPPVLIVATVIILAIVVVVVVVVAIAVIIICSSLSRDSV